MRRICIGVSTAHHHNHKVHRRAECGRRRAGEDNELDQPPLGCLEKCERCARTLKVTRRSRSIERSLTNKQTPSNGSVTRTERDLRVRRVATRLSDCRGQLAHGDRRVHYFHTGNMLAGRTSRHTVSPKLLTCVPHNISTAVINQSHPRPGRRTSPDPRQIPNTTSHIHPLRF